MGETQHNCNPSTQPDKLRCVLAFFTRDNQTENNWWKRSRTYENEPENTNYKSTAGSSQQSSKQKNGDNIVNMIQINMKNQTKRQEFIIKKPIQTTHRGFLPTLQNLLSVVKQRWLSFLGNLSFKDLYESQILKLNKRHYRVVCHQFVQCKLCYQAAHTKAPILNPTKYNNTPCNEEALPEGSS